MAFDKAGLVRMGNNKRNAAPQFWAYRTNDAMGVVDAAGYFDNGDTTNTGMRNHMAVGDMIWLFCTADTLPTFAIVGVVSNASGIVDTSNTMLGTQIDSD